MKIKEEKGDPKKREKAMDLEEQLKVHIKN